jgi:16S rRNA (guanine(966)-N(2))-methyltransferase RsmD
VSEAGRVIAGHSRGRRLAAPGPATRPLGDRAKQTLFAILDPSIDGARVLDLFAGSGAAGIEALSRGAGLAVFVERAADAVRTIERNLAATGSPLDRARIIRSDVMDYLSRPTGAAADGPFDIVILDAPYADEDARQSALALLGGPRPDLLTPDAWVVTTHDRHHPVPAAIGLVASVREKRFGETMLTFYRRRAGDGSG